ncbi:MAG: ATP-binding protein [Planctomycetota bacterium]|nr:ATP-binding protein [Planctomycetota bacterium]
MKFVSQAPLPELLNSVCLAIEAAVPHSRVAVLTREHAAGSLLFRAGPSLPPSLRQALDDPQSGTPLGCASQAVTTGEAAFFEDAPVAVGWRALVDHLHRAQVRSSWSFPIRAAHQGEVIGTVTCFLSRTALPTQAEQQVLGTYADLAQVALQQRRTEDELEQARGQLLAAIDQSPTGIVIAEAPSGRILVANRRALGETVGSGVDVGSMCYEQLPAGWESQDAEGQPIAREDLPLIQALEQGRTLRNVELFQRRGDGVKRWVLASAAPVRDSTGRVRAAVAVYFDITTRKRQEHDLQRLLRSLEAKTEELEQIFWTTTHDLRAPLVNVEGFARELQLGLDELEGHIATADLPIDLRVTLQALLSQELRFSLGHISSSAARMDQLMRGMARLNAVDRNAVAEERVDLGALLREVLGAFEYRLRQDEVQVEVGDLPVCTGDRSQLGQVFSNLVDNAIKYRDPERPARLVIDGWTRNNRAFVSLTDRGLGIEPEQLDKIFRPFHRVRPSGEVGGEGLGLAILQRILARVSGRLRVTSPPGGIGPFEVELPAAQQGLPSPRVGAAS